MDKHSNQFLCDQPPGDRLKREGAAVVVGNVLGKKAPYFSTCNTKT